LVLFTVLTVRAFAAHCLPDAVATNRNQLSGGFERGNIV
jgi:hypothetical protein